MKKTFFVFVLSAICGSAFGAKRETQGTGFVTPTSMTLTFTSLRLVTTSNKQVTLLSGDFTHEFKRADNDFSMVSLTGVTVPNGRYLGVQVCYNTERKVKLDGVKYQGKPGAAGYVDATTQLWTTGSDALAPDSLVTAAPAGGATTVGNYVIGNGSNNCSQSFFSNPVCVGASGSCTAGDTVVDPSSTPPNLNLLLDMYHSVAVDAEHKSLDNHIPVYPYPTIGNPGAAIHLTANDGAGSHANVSLIFSSDKKVLYAAAYGNEVGSFCSGNSFVTVNSSPVPAGGSYNSYGPSGVMSASFAAAGGKVQFVAGGCDGGSSCGSKGMMVVENFVADQGADANVKCIKDSQAEPPYLGWGYTEGAGSAGTAGTMKVKRIIDPGNVFAHCSSTSPGFIAGSAGSCGDYL